MHKAAATLVATLVVALASLTPLSARALADPAPTHAVCMTDAECAQWDAAGYAMPWQDAGDVEPWCPVGQELYDTENPDLGDQGIVCRPLMEV